jgi:tetratricopeptide (TPR) repeat protein
LAAFVLAGCATPLQRAASQGHVDQVASLLKASPKPVQDDIGNALIQASMNGRDDAVRTLLDAGADVDFPNYSTGWSPLPAAAAHLHPNTVKLLLSRGAKASGVPEFLDKYGWPAGAQLLRESVRGGGAGLVERRRVRASEDRQEEIRIAEQAGDTAQAAGDRRKAFDAYAAALSGAWSDDEASVRVRSKFMPLVAARQDLPSPPEEARRRMVRAKALLKDAQDSGGYDRAGAEMMLAIAAAPWWADAYYNLGLVQEKSGYRDDAMSNLKLYLLANPQAPDVRVVQDKIYALEVRGEKQ